MDVIKETRERLGEAPRKFSFWTKFSYLNFSMPAWARNDPMEHCRTAAPELLKHGTVVWGHNVQANSLLYEAGSQDHPAAVVYSPDEVHTPSPGLLASVATTLFSLKGTIPAEPGALLLANHLTDEYSRPFGLPVPASIAGSCPCLFSTIFIVRKHLPDKKLSLSHYPLLISAEYPGMTMIVPSRFWPEDFVAHWIEAGRN